jgi:Flp pilus assembly pilin Flp
MKSIQSFLKRKSLQEEQGVTTVEYAVMLVLVALAIALAAPNIKTAILATFNAVSSVLHVS